MKPPVRGLMRLSRIPGEELPRSWRIWSEPGPDTLADSSDVTLDDLAVGKRWWRPEWAPVRIVPNLQSPTRPTGWWSIDRVKSSTCFGFLRQWSSGKGRRIPIPLQKIVELLSVVQQGMIGVGRADELDAHR